MEPITAMVSVWTTLSNAIANVMGAMCHVLTNVWGPIDEDAFVKAETPAVS